MAHLVEIAFKGNRKEFFLWDGDDPPRVQTVVVVEGDRGEDLGSIHATGELAAKRYAGVAHGEAMVGIGVQPNRRALRLAIPEDVRRAGELDALNEDARRKSMERVRAHNLVMKISDAEWQWDRRKLTLYFTAEKRVDFRALVRDLASQFRTRIELKQIGVRDEAKRLDGVGRCGRQYCSAAWLPELRPVNLSVAKDQRLSLNPTQISGACGRLMCSLRYEHDFYVQQRKRFPKEGKVLTTSRGEEKVVANDIFRERVVLRALDGEVRVVPLGDLRGEMEGLAGPFSAPAGAASDDGEERHADESEREDAVEMRELVPRGRTGDPSRERSRSGGPREMDRASRDRDRRGPERREGERRETDRHDAVAADAAAPSPAAGPDAATPPGMPTIPLDALPDSGFTGEYAISRDYGVTGEFAVTGEYAATGEFRVPVDAPRAHPDAGAPPAGDGPDASAVPGESAEGTEGSDGGEARPRRRRGRRGGRRNRGGRGTSTDGAAGADGGSDDGTDASDDEGADD